MVLIEINSNAVLVEAMKNRTTGEMIRAYQVLMDRLRSAGVTPKMNILDNECSAKFKERIKSNNMKYQLVPPHDHRRNIAEKAIQVFKAPFISILCGTDKSFPLHLWDRLLAQAEHTLNMLRTSKMTPSVSAHACLWGEHNYNANPFDPRSTGMQSGGARHARNRGSSPRAPSIYFFSENSCRILLTRRTSKIWVVIWQDCSAHHINV